MCLIIEKPAGKVIPAHYLNYAANQNSDGCGLAVYREGEKVRIIKGTSDPLTIAKRANEEFKDCLVYVHLRWTTHGANTFANTHPVAVPGAPFVLMHNGILTGYGESAWLGYGKEKTSAALADDEISDTREFAETVLSPLLKASPDIWHLEAFHKLLSDAIGTDKMVLLGQSKAYVINRGYGKTIDGIWYSNEYSLPSKPVEAKPVLLTANKSFRGSNWKELNGIRRTESNLILPNGRGKREVITLPKYSKNKRQRKAEMKGCSYRDVCECHGLCYMQNPDACDVLYQSKPINHNEHVRDVAKGLQDFGQYGIVYGNDEVAEVTLTQDEIDHYMQAELRGDYND